MGCFRVACGAFRPTGLSQIFLAVTGMPALRITCAELLNDVPRLHQGLPITRRFRAISRMRRGSRRRDGFDPHHERA